MSTKKNTSELGASPTSTALRTVPAPVSSPSFTPPLTPSPDSSAIPLTQATQTAVPTASAPILTQAAIDACAVTLPNHSVPPGVEASQEAETNIHGYGELWVALWPGGKILSTKENLKSDGSIEMKFPWWRGVEGQLVIEGYRQDDPTAMLSAWVPDGYGDTGFQSTLITFPTEGCWHITGRVGEAELTFVILVVEVPFNSLWPNWSLPEGMIYKDTLVALNSVQLLFESATEVGGVIQVEISKGLSEDDNVYPDDVQEQANVNGNSAICTRGTFDRSGQWQSNNNVGSLAWADEAFSYRIIYSGLVLGCQDLQQIAESIT